MQSKVGYLEGEAYDMDLLLKFASVVIYVDDVPGVLAFYGRAFGLEPRFYDETAGFAELGPEGSIALASHQAGEYMMPEAYRPPDSSRRSGVEIAFWTQNVRAAYERAVGAGAVEMAPPRVMPWGQTVAYVESVEGTIIGFVTSIEESALSSDQEPVA